MSDTNAFTGSGVHVGEEAEKKLRRRYRKEGRFKVYGVVAILIALGALLWLLVSIIGSGYTAFWRHEVSLEVFLDPEQLDPNKTGDPAVIRAQNYRPLLLEAIIKRFPSVRSEYEARLEDIRAQDRRIEQETADAREARAAQMEFNAEVLELVRMPEAVEIIKEWAIENPFGFDDFETFDLPASRKMALFARTDGATFDALTVNQRMLAQTFLDRGLITVADDGSATLRVKVEFPQEQIDPRESGEEDVIARADFNTILGRSLAAYNIEVSDRYFSLETAQENAADGRQIAERRKRTVNRALFDLRDEILGMISISGASEKLRGIVVPDPSRLGDTVTIRAPVASDLDMFLKGYISEETPEESRKVTDRQIRWTAELRDEGNIKAAFNDEFLLGKDSQDPELAGIFSAFMGSILALTVTFILSFPIAVAAAIYLEEFAPKNRFTDLIEVNINNLAAVPSIVFGLLGLAVFLNFFGLPRSAPLVGGMVLALMTLPTIIIATRAALKAVPPSIREGALGVGASPIQAVFHHVLPLAAGGILTGTIIGMAQALGETAPLLMIGMVAFVTEIPYSFTDPAAALPVQIYQFSDRPELGFREKTSASIIVLLILMLIFNILAIWLRNRLERRW